MDLMIWHHMLCPNSGIGVSVTGICTEADVNAFYYDILIRHSCPRLNVCLILISLPGYQEEPGVIVITDAI